MTRAEKLYETLKTLDEEKMVFMHMNDGCPGDYEIGPEYHRSECHEIGEDCFKCWMAEYKEEE